MPAVAESEVAGIDFLLEGLEEGPGALEAMRGKQGGCLLSVGKLVHDRRQHRPGGGAEVINGLAELLEGGLWQASGGQIAVGVLELEHEPLQMVVEVFRDLGFAPGFRHRPLLVRPAAEQKSKRPASDFRVRA